MKATFKTDKYVNAHGKGPKGWGNWAFVPADSVWPVVVPPDGVAWAWGSYTDAKREVARTYPEVTVWTVLS